MCGLVPVENAKIEDSNSHLQKECPVLSCSGHRRILNREQLRGNQITARFESRWLELTPVCRSSYLWKTKTDP